MKKDKNERRENRKAVKRYGHDKHNTDIAIWVLDSKVNVFGQMSGVWEDLVIELN